MQKFVKKLLGGDEQKKNLKRLQKRVDAIDQLAKSRSIDSMDVAAIRARMDEIKADVRAKESKKDIDKALDEHLPEVFAMARRGGELLLEMRHFDVQLIGGMVLHEGSVAEMRTGEGKTLVATLPVILNALSGRGVHVVTVNDYLAQRDAGWMAELYYPLGLSLAVIIANSSFIYDPEHINEDHDDPRMKHLRPCSRLEAYDADITYGTNNEFGFDYLRDNMAKSKLSLRQRSLSYAIVDEVDSILIDEARTPLIISSPASASGNLYGTFAGVAKRLGEDDYELDEKRKSVTLNDEGTQRVQKMLGIDNLYAPENVKMIYHLDQALRADKLFKKDKDYVVDQSGEVIIVDEFTGRLMHGRRYNEGLHQAIEAKEGVEIQQESSTLATISFQNLFRLYDKLSGMTGTAETESEEFYEIYELEVFVIPTNKPIQREDRTDRIYATEQAKFDAIIAEVKEHHELGRPVLIGTASIDKNERLSHLLTKVGLTHSVLNAKNNESEAATVAKAGEKGAITIATNIAGRGTDIKLADGVVELGGLVVIGSERHESRRIDNQLRGRCGRQGDPGMTQFYVSATDDLMRIFGGERIAALMARLTPDDNVAIENKALSKSLESAQKKVEGHNFDIRKNVVQYDDVMNRHRKAIYSIRQKLLHQDDVQTEVKQALEDEAKIYVLAEDEDKKEVVHDLHHRFRLDTDEQKRLLGASNTSFADELSQVLEAKYQAKEDELGDSLLRAAEREIYLQILDNLWMQHLENMDHLNQGIRLRAHAQKDPLVEYRREGQRLFDSMQGNLRSELTRTLFHIAPKPVATVAQEEVKTALTEAAEKFDAATEKAAKKTDPKLSKSSSTFRKGKTEADKRNENRAKRAAKKSKKQSRKKGTKK